MLSVGKSGRRFIDYLIRNAYEAGYREIILVLHPDNTDIEPYVREMAIRDGYGDLSICVARQFIPEGREKPFGSGDAVYQAVSQCPPKNGWYTLSNSDNLSSVDALKTAFESERNTLLSYDFESLGIPKERRSSYGIVVTDGERVEALREKPPANEILALEAMGKMLSINMNLATMSLEDTLPFLSTLIPHPTRGEKEVTDVYSALIGLGKLDSVILKETIPDLTSKADIVTVQRYLAEAYSAF